MNSRLFSWGLAFLLSCAAVAAGFHLAGHLQTFFAVNVIWRWLLIIGLDIVVRRFLLPMADEETRQCSLCQPLLSIRSCWLLYIVGEQAFCWLLFWLMVLHPSVVATWPWIWQLLLWLSLLATSTFLLMTNLAGVVAALSIVFVSWAIERVVQELSGEVDD